MSQTVLVVVPSGVDFKKICVLPGRRHLRLGLDDKKLLAGEAIEVRFTDGNILSGTVISTEINVAERGLKMEFLEILTHLFGDTVAIRLQNGMFARRK